MKFKWACAVDGEVDDISKNMTIVDPSDENTDKGGCFGSGPGRLNTSDMVYSFKASMTHGFTYRVTLFVEKAGLRGSYSQTLYIAETPPKYNLRYVNSDEPSFSRTVPSKLCGWSPDAFRLALKLPPSSKFQPVAGHQCSILIGCWWQNQNNHGGSISFCWFSKFIPSIFDRQVGFSKTNIPIVSMGHESAQGSSRNNDR